MKKAVLVYGLFGGLLIGALRLVQHRFLAVEHSVEIDAAAFVAALFAVSGSGSG